MTTTSEHTKAEAPNTRIDGEQPSLRLAQCAHDTPPSLSTIKQVCEEHVRELGYHYFSYVGYFYPLFKETHEMSTFPEEWSSLNSRLTDATHNPIEMFSKNKTTAFFWTDIKVKSDPNILHSDDYVKGLAALRVTAGRSNIHDGICFPIHGPGAERATFNVARNTSEAEVNPTKIRRMQLLAMTLHDAVKQANSVDEKEQVREKILSPRERECLDWIAAGKTAWETAQIIGVAESTISFHVRNTIKKLNANNRAHAVAIAMSRSLITSPPYAGTASSI